VTGFASQEAASTPVGEGKWETLGVASVPAQQTPAATSQFTPVDTPLTSSTAGEQTGGFPPVPTPPPQNGNTGVSSSSGWGNVAAAAVPAAGPAASTTPSGQQSGFTPVSGGGSTSTSAPGNPWSQSPPVGYPSAAAGGLAVAAPPRRSILPKLIAVAVVLILLVGAVVVGGVVYVGYKVRQKTRAMTQSLSQLAKENGLDKGKGDSPSASAAISGLLDALKRDGASADGIPILSNSDPATPCTRSAFPAQDKARVPFKPGTVFTTAWGIKYGDVEARHTIDSIDGAMVSTTSVTQEYKNDNGGTSKESSISNQNCSTDYASAGSFMTVSSMSMPRLIHDLTRFRVSDRVFEEIKSTGKTDLQYVDILHAGGGVKLTSERGLLKRVEPQDLRYPMIVNDQRVELPVIHLAGVTATSGKDPRPVGQRPTSSSADLYLLDDPADPLILNWKLKNRLYHDGNFRVEIVKINFPVAKPENILEKQLTTEKRAVTYGIYFDFNKDTLKPESQPVLNEIAQAMTHNPDWKLTVEGHTDNIGGDPYNLELSNRRAAAVKQALVSQFDIAADRLLTGGFGASRPIETNDTLEGRARNRRVELVRQ
jgi:outer membrane protein OmpA-like peptidoglycan-associated protein